jgi:hypothetical protein
MSNRRVETKENRVETQTDNQQDTKPTGNMNHRRYVQPISGKFDESHIPTTYKDMIQKLTSMPGPSPVWHHLGKTWIQGIFHPSFEKRRWCRFAMYAWKFVYGVLIAGADVSVKNYNVERSRSPVRKKRRTGD